MCFLEYNHRSTGELIAPDDNFFFKLEKCHWLFYEVAHFHTLELIPYGSPVECS